MTEAIENASGETSKVGRSFGRILARLAAPALVLVAIVVPFLRYHQYDMLLPESLILLGGAAAIGIAVGAVMLIRPTTFGPALMALTLGVYVFYRPEVKAPVLQAADSLGDMIGNMGLVLGVFAVAMFLALFAVCLAARRNLETIVVAIFGTIVLSTVILPTTTGGEAKVSGALPAKLSDLPPVIHVVLDEHIGPEGLPPEVAESAEAERTIKSTYSDFALFSRAYSRFAETRFSLASLMNGDMGADVDNIVEDGTTIFTLHQNQWFDTLKRKGYAIKVYQTAWFDMCSGSDAVDACYTYPLFSPNVLQRTPLSTKVRFDVLFKKLMFGAQSLQTGPMAAMEALKQFRSDVAEHPRGVAYVVHLLLPHYDYFYKADCTLAPPDTWERDRYGDDEVYTPEERDMLYDRYLGQTICAEKQMQAVFAELKSLGVYDDATIIVHGDHGSRIGERPHIIQHPEVLTEQDLVDHYNALLAVKAPGFAPGIHRDPVMLQHLFAANFLREPDKDDSGEVLVRTDKDDNFASREMLWPGPKLAKAPDVDGNLNALGLTELRR